MQLLKRVTSAVVDLERGGHVLFNQTEVCGEVEIGLLECQYVVRPEDTHIGQDGQGRESKTVA